MAPNTHKSSFLVHFIYWFYLEFFCSFHYIKCVSVGCHFFSLYSGVISPAILQALRAAIPSHFCTRDWFHSDFFQENWVRVDLRAHNLESLGQADYSRVHANLILLLIWQEAWNLRRNAKVGSGCKYRWAPQGSAGERMLLATLNMRQSSCLLALT